MKFALLLAALTQEPLFLLPDKARTVIDLVQARAYGVASGRLDHGNVRGNAASAHSEPGVVKYDYDDEHPSQDVPPPPLYVRVGNVAVISVEGLIGKRLSGMAIMCGGCDLDQVSRALTAAAADTNVTAIFLDLNTPGGMGVGLREISALIAQIRKTKPVIAFTDFQACSAGYWIAAQADQFFCTPSAIVGSIGAFLACEDDSKAWEMAGRERLVFNGNASYKAMGTSGKQWTQAEKDFMQARSEAATTSIRAAAQANRTLALEDMQGQVFDGTDALAHNLVDGLVNSRDELLSQLCVAFAK